MVVTVRDFTSEEVIEIYNVLEKYASVNVIAEQFKLTEKAQEKIEIFVNVYRMLNSCMNGMSTKELKTKLEDLLFEAEDLYEKLYHYINQYKSCEVHYIKFRYLKNMRNLMEDINNIAIANKLIDIFIVLGGRIELYDINKLGGLNLETEAGKKLKKDIVGALETKKEVVDSIEVDDSKAEETELPKELDNLENEYDEPKAEEATDENKDDEEELKI